MQGTADFHDAIANAGLPEAAGVVDDAAALDAAVDVLKAHAAARDASFGAIVATRGETGAGVGGCSGGRASAVASATATPRRCASSVKDRAGVSPGVRNVACRTIRRTWIHGWAWPWPIPHGRPCTTCRG